MCVYCQNKQISTDSFGKEISVKRLSEIFLSLQEMEAHNINLVTPTPYVPLICRALDLVRGKLEIPVVYNCGGYENPAVIRFLDSYIDIYLTDFKYYDTDIAKKYSYAPNYRAFALSSIEEMIKTTGKPIIHNGLMKKGVILRHLVLPSHRKDSIALLELLKKRFGTENFILSLMSQYFPQNDLTDFPEINRKITEFEYRSVLDFALDMGFDNAFVQNRSSADSGYVPKFDLSGVD